MHDQGDILIYDSHFLYHLKETVPVQVYDPAGAHVGIGLVARFNEHFVEIDTTLYNRLRFTFVSRPGY
ncbi:hypothetical protein OIN60_20895 [Paenibacillus sp. P96]|uniref:Peptidase A1 domain-containing protein n=1 Tax=Paenibacillus zeirhizosphaerae TaxID=2987519 RepID=A0ABT9FWS8_9BACL|nr:hypothetical protein [Paenibacillus sp. P96]MDP4099179.1 hypothetical protein [Paenibacillus sp. P96]